jgi:hypothetical protein
MLWSLTGATLRSEQYSLQYDLRHTARQAQFDLNGADDAVDFL